MDEIKRPGQLRAESSTDDEYWQLMSDYGWRIPRHHPDHERRRELGIRPGYRLPQE